MTTVPHRHIVVENHPSRSLTTVNISKLLDNLLENYDNMLRPDFGGRTNTREERGERYNIDSQS